MRKIINTIYYIAHSNKIIIIMKDSQYNIYIAHYDLYLCYRGKGCGNLGVE